MANGQVVMIVEDNRFVGDALRSVFKIDSTLRQYDLELFTNHNFFVERVSVMAFIPDLIVLNNRALPGDLENSLITAWDKWPTLRVIVMSASLTYEHNQASSQLVEIVARYACTALPKSYPTDQLQYIEVFKQVLSSPASSLSH